MASILPFLDRQHSGKRGRGPGETRPEDLGAAADIDGDGIVEVWEREAHLTPVYGMECVRDLAQAGVGSVFWDPAGSGIRNDYWERHRKAIELAETFAGKVPYLALHMNAGGGSYGLIGYDPRSVKGKELAEVVAEHFRSKVTVLDGYCRVQALEGKWSRGLPCIDGVYAGPANICGVLLEPLFIDNPHHQQYINEGGLIEVGSALAEALLEWGAS